MNQSWGPAIEALLHQLGLTTGDIARFALFALVLIVLVPVYFIAKILGGTTDRGRIDISFGRGSSDSFASDSDDSITAGSPLWRFASAANGLNLVVILLIAFALIVWLQTREKVPTELQCAVLYVISDRLLRRCVGCLRCVGRH